MSARQSDIASAAWMLSYSGVKRNRGVYPPRAAFTAVSTYLLSRIYRRKWHKILGISWGFSGFFPGRFSPQSQRTDQTFSKRADTGLIKKAHSSHIDTGYVQSCLQ
jgi:hypothetical protein